MDTGLVEELARCNDGPRGTFGLEQRDIRFGVLGGVDAPFPFVELSPIAFTKSFTETPTSSGGMSLLEKNN